MFLGRARMELPKDSTTWRRLFPWEGGICWNLGWGKSQGAGDAWPGGEWHHQGPQGELPTQRQVTVRVVLRKTVQTLMGGLPTEQNPPD